MKNQRITRVSWEREKDIDILVSGGRIQFTINNDMKNRMYLLKSLVLRITYCSESLSKKRN